MALRDSQFRADLPRRFAAGQPKCDRFPFEHRIVLPPWFNFTGVGRRFFRFFNYFHDTELSKFSPLAGVRQIEATSDAFGHH